jgi:outer membrane protein OmpA-like peptidoglycan-associated protein
VIRPGPEGPRRAGSRRRPIGAAAALLLGLGWTAAGPAAAAPRFPDPLVLGLVHLAQGAKSPPAGAPAVAEDADAAPPLALPPRARFGTAQMNTGGAALSFPNASVSLPSTALSAPRSQTMAPGESAAAPGIAAPGIAPPGIAAPDAVALPGEVRPGTDADRARGRRRRVEADAGPPDTLPPGARLGMSPIAFSSAELRFADSRVSSGSASIAAPRVAALPGGMAMREEGRGLRVTLDADVLFDFDRAELRPEAGPRLQRLMAEVSARIPRPAFRVEGHTDWIGSDAYNLRLSARRADSVRTWLVQAGGVPRPAVSTAGFGESRPVAPNSTPDGRGDPDGRQRNRRVELLVRPR